MATHLMHELVAVRAQLSAAYRLADYARHHGRVSAPSATMDWIEVASNANDAAIDGVDRWLSAQVIGLYDPVRTTNVLHDPHG